MIMPALALTYNGRSCAIIISMFTDSVIGYATKDLSKGTSQRRGSGHMVLTSCNEQSTVKKCGTSSVDGATNDLLGLAFLLSMAQIIYAGTWRSNTASSKMVNGPPYLLPPILSGRQPEL
jgi:hypothetical protein